MEIEKQAPQRTNLMIGRTEIPKWSGQNDEGCKYKTERWTLNNKSSDVTK